MNAIEILPPEQTGPAHPEWFQKRTEGVAASEIAAVMGISPWDSPFAAYWRKCGLMPEQADTDAMRWGRRLEGIVAEEFAERHEEELDVNVAGLYAHNEREWQLASPDRVLRSWRGFEPVALLECKTAHSWDDWGPEGTDEVPIHIRAQVLWQLDVCGLDTAYVACLVGGRSYREYVVSADQADAKLMRDAALEFLDRVRSGDPPDVDGSPATIGALKRLHSELDDEMVVVPNTLAEAYRRACRNAEKAKDRKRLIEAKLRQRMGRAKHAVDRDGEKVATRVISTVSEHVRAESTRDYLTLAREKTT